MILALLINSRSILAVNTKLAPGFLVIDGIASHYGDDPVRFAFDRVKRGRAATVIVPGNSVAEYLAALILLGFTVRANVLAAHALNCGRVVGEIKRLDRQRTQLCNVAGLGVFVRWMIDAVDTHVVETSASTLHLPLAALKATGQVPGQA